MKMRKEKKVKLIIAIVIACVLLAVVGISVLLGINARVKAVGGEGIITPEEAASFEDVDCIIVLGCLVKNDGTPSDMLNDRLKRGTELYFAGAAPKIIMSGDHGTEEYDEVNAMKQFAIDAGIEPCDVFMDHAGFSTYESIYRAKEIFGAEKIIIVTQEYHLYRAIYIARGLGIEAYGVGADYRTYRNQMQREIREVFARFKDFVNTIFKPEPTYLGEPIDINGDGNVTNG